LLIYVTNWRSIVGYADDTETEATTSEEDSIIIELADVAYEQVDPDEFDIIELDLDQLGIVEETGITFILTFAQFRNVLMMK